MAGSRSSFLIAMPSLSIKLSGHSAHSHIDALVDSGSMINALPFSIGIKFGVDWDSLPELPRIGGALSATSSKPLLLDVTINPFKPVTMAFAWLDVDIPHVILGGSGFFNQFDVCFHRSQLYFEVQPKP
jgi:hypothetical protein